MPQSCKPLTIFAPLTLMLTFSASLPAQEVNYIRDTLYVSLRGGPTDSSEVTATDLPSGTRLEVHEVSENERYALVKTPAGEQGWIQTQYLIETPPAQTLLKQTKQELATLKSENQRLSGTRGQLEQDYVEARNQVTALTAETQQLSAELQEIKAVSSNAIAIQQENHGLSEENATLKTRVGNLEVANAELQSEVGSQDFRNGALAVIAGMILALILPRLMPRKKSDWT